MGGGHSGSTKLTISRINTAPPPANWLARHIAAQRIAPPPRTLPADWLARCVYLDTETTGTDPDYDELVELAIVDGQGRTLLDTWLRPVRMGAWPGAEAVHGISPADVWDAPSLPDVADRVRAAVQDRIAVIYNAAFDTQFLTGLLWPASSVRCCMLAWAEHVGERSRFRRGGYRWFKLEEAAAKVGFEWPARAHNAGVDALATRAVWHHLHDAKKNFWE